MHWCCAAVNIKEKRFEYYDSMGKPRDFVYQVRFCSLSPPCETCRPGQVLRPTKREGKYAAARGRYGTLAPGSDRGTNLCLDHLQALRKWLKEEHKSRKGTEIDLSDWEDYWDPVRTALLFTLFP